MDLSGVEKGNSRLIANIRTQRLTSFTWGIREPKRLLLANNAVTEIDCRLSLIASARDAVQTPADHVADVLSTTHGMR